MISILWLTYVILLYRKDRELAEIKRKAQHHLLDDPDALKRIKDLEKDQSKAAEKLEAINKEERVRFLKT